MSTTNAVAKTTRRREWLWTTPGYCVNTRPIPSTTIRLAPLRAVLRRLWRIDTRADLPQ
jgi:hypothetical protein